MFTTLFFPNTLIELIILLLIVLVAGIVRGAIGFGFSALVIASAGFWLPPVAVICLVILLEFTASLLMLAQSKSSINKVILWRISLSGALSGVIGVALLATLDQHLLTIIITIYLGSISLLTLSGFTFKNAVNLNHYTLVGLFAGLVNGLAGMGGLLIAFFMHASNTNVGQLRATISAYFLFSEIIFVAAAYVQNLYTLQILTTAVLCLIPLWLGTKLGSFCFHYYTEEQLKRAVLYTLLILSCIGLIKTLSN